LKDCTFKQCNGWWLMLVIFWLCGGLFIDNGENCYRCEYHEQVKHVFYLLIIVRRVSRSNQNPYSKKNIQRNGQKKKNKTTSNDMQIIHKTKMLEKWSFPSKFLLSTKCWIFFLISIWNSISKVCVRKA
jgi:hypothetical protein